LETDRAVSSRPSTSTPRPSSKDLTSSSGPGTPSLSATHMKTLTRCGFRTCVFPRLDQRLPLAGRPPSLSSADKAPKGRHPASAEASTLPTSWCLGEVLGELRGPQPVPAALSHHRAHTEPPSE